MINKKEDILSSIFYLLSLAENAALRAIAILTKRIYLEVNILDMILSRKTMALFSAFLFLLLSCKKDKLPDANGNTLDKETTTDYISNNSYSIQYNYSTTGDLISITGIPSDPNRNTQILTYDAQGKLLKYKLENIVEYEFIYDANKRVIKKIGTPILQNLSPTNWAYAYDTQGRIIADSAFQDNGNVTSYQTYQYDNNNNVTGYQQFLRAENEPYTSDGLFNITYDKKINPYSKIGKTLFYINDGNFQYLSSANAISIKKGGIDFTNNSLPTYDYYSNGLVWKTSFKAPNINTVTSYTYKQP